MSGLWAGVITHLWQTTIVLAVIALLALLLRRAPARYVEGLWTLGLLKLLLPLPLFAAAWPAMTRLLSNAEQQETIGPAVQTLSQIAYPEMLWVPPAEEPGGMATMILAGLTAAWVLGASTCLLAWWRRTRIPAPPTAAAWHAPDNIVERVSRIASECDVPLNRIRFTDADVVPCVRNFRRPVVILSTSVVDSLRDDELRAVILHEDAHRRRGDLWRSTIEQLGTRILFFYPPSWWLAKRLRASAEMACDEAVLAAGVNARTYARALARTVVLELTPSPSPALSSGRSHLQVRLQRIQNPGRYVPRMRHRIALVLAVGTLIGLSFAPVADAARFPNVGALQEEWLPASQLSTLNGLDGEIQVDIMDTPIAEAMQLAGRLADFEVYFTSADDLSVRVSRIAGDMTVRSLLTVLGDSYGLEYRVVDPQTLIVRVREDAPDRTNVTVTAPTPSGIWQDVLDSIPATVIAIDDDDVSRAIRNIREMNGLESDEAWESALGQNGVTEVQLREQIAEQIEEQRRARAQGPEPMRVGGDIEEPERIHYVAPEYPQAARRARMEGFIILRATIDVEGNVRHAEVLRGLGLGLDQSAIDAVRQWKYTPTYYNGDAVEVILTVNVIFQLIQ